MPDLARSSPLGGANLAWNKMKQIRTLIVHPPTRTSSQLAHLCAKGLSELGHKAELYLFQPHRYSSILGLKGLFRIEYLAAEAFLSKKIEDFRPELVLVIKGDEVSSDTVKMIRQKFSLPVANWWIDDPCLLSVSSALSPAYDVFFTNDPDSVPVHEAAGCRKSRFLTFACDPDLHRKAALGGAERAKYGSDLVFVGLLTPRRVEFLEALSGFDLKIWSNRFTREFLPERNVVVQRDIHKTSPIFGNILGREVWDEELIKIYSAAKVVLNIHAHGKSDPNIRVFEATGCGSFLLTENRRLLGDFFEPGYELDCFDSVKSLKELAGYYVRNAADREKIAAAGQKRAYKDHTYRIRMKEMLGFLGFS